MDSSDFILSAIAANASAVAIAAAAAPTIDPIVTVTETIAAEPIAAPAEKPLIVPAVETDFDIDTAAMSPDELQYWCDNREFIRDTWNSTDSAYQFYAIDYKVKTALVKAAHVIATTGNISAPMPPISSRDNRELFAVMISTGSSKPAAQQHTVPAEKTAMDKFIAECIATNACATAMAGAGVAVESPKVASAADDAVASEIMTGWTNIDTPVVAGFVPTDACPPGQTPPGVSAATHTKTTAGWFPISDAPPGQVAASISMGVGSNGKSDVIAAKTSC